MKKKLRTWSDVVSSAFPTTFIPYWSMLPLGRMKMSPQGTSWSEPPAVSRSIC